MSFIGMYVVLGGFFGLVKEGKHVLGMMMSLEIMVMGVILVGGGGLSDSAGGYLFFLVIFVMGACEGGLGLGILVTLIRSHGGESVGGFNLLEC